jgi:hypothetical protein
MKRTLAFCLTATLGLSTVHRAPAPISEIESATPAPKRTFKHKESESSEGSTKKKTSSPTPKNQATPNRTPFAGTWVGTTGVPMFGKLQYTFTVSADGSTVRETSSAGSHTWPATWDGTSLKWVASSAFTTNPCILTPNADGQTAQVIIGGPLIDNFAPTYRRQTSKSN